ncbi:unnamed protein product [Ixodes hexagonus]
MFLEKVTVKKKKVVWKTVPFLRRKTRARTARTRKGV